MTKSPNDSTNDTNKQEQGRRMGDPRTGTLSDPRPLSGESFNVPPASTTVNRFTERN